MNKRNVLIFCGLTGPWSPLVGLLFLLLLRTRCTANRGIYICTLISIYEIEEMIAIV